MTTIELETLTLAKKAARKYLNDDVDWEQRRYEVAKTILPSVYTQVWKVLERGGNLIEVSMGKQCATIARELADALIKELRTHKNEQQ